MGPIVSVGTTDEAKWIPTARYDLRKHNSIRYRTKNQPHADDKSGAITE
jgi:hypothetical protein